MSESYAGQRIVGIDLHRRRSVIVRMTETGEHLETVRIVNDQERMAAVMAAAGESPSARGPPARAVPTAIAPEPPPPDKPPPSIPHKSATAIPSCSHLPVDE